MKTQILEAVIFGLLLLSLPGALSSSLRAAISLTVSNTDECGDPGDEDNGELVLNSVLGVMGLVPGADTVGAIIGIVAPFFTNNDGMFNQIKDYVKCELKRAIDDHEQQQLDMLIKGYQDHFALVHQAHVKLPSYKDILANFVLDADKDNSFFMGRKAELSIQYYRIWVTMHLSAASELVRLTDDNNYRLITTNAYNEYSKRATELLDELVDWRLGFIQDSCPLKCTHNHCCNPAVCRLDYERDCSSGNHTLCVCYCDEYHRYYSALDQFNSHVIASGYCEPNQGASRTTGDCMIARQQEDAFKKDLERDLRQKWAQPVDKWLNMMKDLSKFGLTTPK